MSTRRALITGVSGQDGSYLAELLVEQGYDVVGMVREPVGREIPNLEAVRSQISLVPGDLLDFASLRDAVQTVRPDELYHLAAPTFAPDSWESPSETIVAVAGASAALMAAARDLDSEVRVYVAGSSQVFGNSSESPQDEDSPMNPMNPYGVGKLAAHRLVGVLRAHHRQFISAGITYNHESVRRPERFLPRKVTRGVAAIKLGLAPDLVLGDLDAVRDWCFAGDVVRGAWLALQADEPRDYVFASGVGRTVRDLAATAFAHVGLEMDRHVRVDPAFVRTREPTPMVGDASRARTLLGWEPEVGFEEMIGAMVDFDLAELASGTAAPGRPAS